MIERELRERVQETIEVVGATCDRCGSELRQVSGISVWRDFPFKGGVVRGRRYPVSGNAAEIRLVEAELCADCLLALESWINAGPGPGIRVEDKIEHTRRITEAARRG